MKVKCSHCSTSYSVDDAKVTGKKFGFDCPKCGTNVVIDNRAKDESAPAPAALSEIDFSEPALSSDFSFNEPAPELSASAPSGMDFLNNELSSPFSLDEEAPADSGFSGALDSGPETQIDDDFEPEIDLSVLQNGNTPDDDILSADFSAGIPEEDLSLSSFSAPLSVEEIPSSVKSSPLEPEEDENITIDLNSLDIDLAEPEEMPVADFSSLDDNDPDSEKIIIDEAILAAAAAPMMPHIDDDDESITLDLDSLDIPLEEDSTVKEGISALTAEDDSRLSLNDAGISFDQVADETTVSLDNGDEDDKLQDMLNDDEDDFHLTLDEIDDSIDIDDINRFTEPAVENSFQPETELPIYEAMQDKPLPEVDIDRFATITSFTRDSADNDKFLDLENTQTTEEFSDQDFNDEQVASVGGGYIDFSIDYALHYSRLKAALRLFGLYNIIFIPHLFVTLIFSAVAGIINFLNTLITLFSGSRERDFSLLQENYLRYSITLLASIVNVTEEYPSFSGRKDIDSQIQLNITYPPQSSRVLAFMRVTFIGIVLAALPHLLLLAILSVGMSLISFFSLIFVIFAGRWPSIMFDFMVRYLRYLSSVSAYMSGLVDTYPSFRFE